MNSADIHHALDALALPDGHWAVHASAVLVLHGITQDAGDVDVIASGPAWRRALELGEPRQGRQDLCVAVPDLGVEVWSGWLDEDVGALIGGAERVDGVPCVQLEAVLRFKEAAGRPKDEPHVRLLRERLGLPVGDGRSR